MDPAKSDVSNGGNTLPPAPECPQCHRKVMSLAAPRCVFCGAPVREGEVHWDQQNEKTPAVPLVGSEGTPDPALPPPLPAGMAAAASMNTATAPYDDSAFRGGTPVPIMNSPVRDFFFPQYLGRLAYLGRLVLVSIMALVFAFLVFGSLQDPVRIISMVLAVVFVTIYQVAALSTARARDAGQSSWFALLLFVPLVGLYIAAYLHFAPSSGD